MQSKDTAPTEQSLTTKEQIKLIVESENEFWGFRKGLILLLFGSFITIKVNKASKHKRYQSPRLLSICRVIGIGGNEHLLFALNSVNINAKHNDQYDQ